MKEMSESLSLKVSEAMHRIESLYNETNGKCYLSFSGGKDSTIILALIKMCEDIYTIPKNAIKAVFVNTRIELDATEEFVHWCKENWYENIEIICPEKSFSEVLSQHGKPIKSKMKSECLERYQKRYNETSRKMLLGVSDSLYNKVLLANKDLHLMHDDFKIDISNKCCDFLKKKPIRKYCKQNEMTGYYLGIRLCEGGARELNAKQRLKSGGKLCTGTRRGIIVKMPIIDWTDEDVQEFIEYYNIPLSRAYTEYGMRRTGCIGCPFSIKLKDDLEILYKYEPNKYKACMFWLKDVYIAQNVSLEFDDEYEKERRDKWLSDGGYFDMRREMLEKYRPDKLRERFYNKELFK